MGWRGWHHLALCMVAVKGKSRRGGAINVDALDDLFMVEAGAWPEQEEIKDQWADWYMSCMSQSIAPRLSPDLMQKVAVAKTYLLFADAMPRIYLLHEGEEREARVQELAACLQESPAIVAETRPLIRQMMRLARAAMNLGKGISLAQAWQEYCDAITPSAAVIAPAPDTPAAETKLRRLAANASMQLLDYQQMTAKMNEMLEAVARHSAKNGFAPLVELGVAALLAKDFSKVRLVTFMTQEAYDSFIVSGTYQGLWERGVEWQSKFSDLPEATRAAAEGKVFGERGDRITYGYLATNDPWLARITESGVRQYGPVRVEWSPAILPICTMTIEQSMGAGRLYDAERAEQLAYLTIVCALLTREAWAEPRGMAELRGYAGVVPGDCARYIEFQCHRLLTIGDIAEVTYHSEGL